jgi:DNA-binding MarR family transcriptional regulator
MSAAIKTKRVRVLRALARFDAASSPEVATVIGSDPRNVWGHLKALEVDGYAERVDTGEQRSVRYRITEAGRVALKAAA